MDVLGWGLFAVGALLLILFAFIGIDVGGIAVTNLAGTLTGVATMISGAVFIAGSNIEKALGGRASISSAPIQPSSGNVLGTKPSEQHKASGHIKSYKGHDITRCESGVYVDGNQFPNVLAAEKWINEKA